MKTLIKLAGVVFALALVQVLQAQQTDLQYFRTPGQKGLNVFETPKTNDVEYQGLKVRVGGDFAIQFQGLSHSNDFADTLGMGVRELGKNFNLPTANLNVDAQLADGLRVHLRTYLSSRHHTESYVKGGYIQVDNLNFVSEGFLQNFMNVATIRFGMDDINYGDAHFRRSDNACAIYNPFVGNYIFDAFTTEPFAEVTIQTNGILGVLGATNGRLNQSPTVGDQGIVIYAKLGYDKQLSDDLRLRLTGSIYNSSGDGTRDYLYGGDRAGARYYNVMWLNSEAADSDFSGRYNPGYKTQTAFQVNPFVKYKGLEFFGIYEMVNNGDSDAGGSFTQLGAELLYRFGGREQLYVGGRYNAITGNQTDAAADLKINRINLGAGWFLTPNTLAKLEYVMQKYDGDYYLGTGFQGGEFSGVMLEAVIGF
ncbi:MAG: hypothetical protein K9I85_11080 [Saprospiraceae bacterium]|nr:hypothetical protein [Saprospiraceae bacterium]